MTNNKKFVTMQIEEDLAKEIQKNYKKEYWKVIKPNKALANNIPVVGFKPVDTSEQFWLQYVQDLADAGGFGEEWDEESGRELPKMVKVNIVNEIMNNDDLWDAFDFGVQEIVRNHNLIPKPKNKKR